MYTLSSREPQGYPQGIVGVQGALASFAWLFSLLSLLGLSSYLVGFRVHSNCSPPTLCKSYAGRRKRETYVLVETYVLDGFT
jgi:hypothetical protein